MTVTHAIADAGGPRHQDHDPINSPRHYRTAAGIEAIDVLEQYGLGLHLATAMAYLLRAGKKDTATELEDCRKALWWLERWVAGFGDMRHGVDLPVASDDIAGGVCWRDPRAIADAFALSGYRRAAVEAILSAAAFGDEDARVMASIDALRTDIAILTAAALPQANSGRSA